MHKRIVLFGLLLCFSAVAEVARIELSERADVLGGRAFGKTGPYEKLTGRIYFTLDPAAKANQIIADIGKAPRNEAGLVEFSADLMVLKPLDPAKGNGAVLFEVGNRGGKSMLGMFNTGASTRNPARPEDFGDGFLMEQGYTLAWVGWQFDVPNNADLIRLYAPVATAGGQTITGPVRAEFVVDTRQVSRSLGDRNHTPYRPVNPSDPKLTLTVRDSVLGRRTVIPRNKWKIVEGTHIVMEQGFEPGRLYEIVYEARDPALVGLGPAAIRDFISFLKYGDGKGITVLSDHRRYIKRAYGYGVSQCGRFLRTFAYYGFNADVKDRQVFDGMLVHVAGAGRGSFNHRFAQPSRDGHPFMNTLYPTDIYPFSDLPQADPETGLNEGLLDRAAASKAVPKIFYANSSYEYWGRAASLIHTTLDGAADAPLAPTSRAFLFAGGQHGPAAMPPAASDAVHTPNFNMYTAHMRALLVALDDWVNGRKEPPASMIPSIQAQSLVPVASLRFPKLAGVRVPSNIQKAYRVNYGPAFRTEGIVSVEPGQVGKPFPALVPQVDADGNEVSGIRTPMIQVPLGTYTGWNLRSPRIGAPGELFSMVGSFLPFAKTRAERMKSKDPRPSIEERYRDKADYMERVAAANQALMDAGLLLDRDAARLTARCSAAWDWMMTAASARK